jgi:hypothetical protein
MWKAPSCELLDDPRGKLRVGDCWVRERSVAARGPLASQTRVGNDVGAQHEVRPCGHRGAGAEHDPRAEFDKLLEHDRGERSPHAEGGHRQRRAAIGAGHGAQTTRVGHHPRRVEARGEEVDASGVADQDAARTDLGRRQAQIPGSLHGMTPFALSGRARARR